MPDTRGVGRLRSITERLRAVVWSVREARIRATWRVLLAWPVLWFVMGTIAVAVGAAIIPAGISLPTNIIYPTLAVIESGEAAYGRSSQCAWGADEVRCLAEKLTVAGVASREPKNSTPQPSSGAAKGAEVHEQVGRLLEEVELVRAAAGRFLVHAPADESPLTEIEEDLRPMFSEAAVVDVAKAGWR